MEQSQQLHAHPRYEVVWIVLAAVTFGELGLAFMSHLPHTTVVVILLALSAWKALLVALYFMHLKYETYRVRILMALPLGLIVALLSATVWDWSR